MKRDKIYPGPVVLLVAINFAFGSLIYALVKGGLLTYGVLPCEGVCDITMPSTLEVMIAGLVSLYIHIRNRPTRTFRDFTLPFDVDY